MRRRAKESHLLSRFFVNLRVLRGSSFFSFYTASHQKHEGICSGRTQLENLGRCGDERKSVISRHSEKLFHLPHLGCLSIVRQAFQKDPPVLLLEHAVVEQA